VRIYKQENVRSQDFFGSSRLWTVRKLKI